MKNNLCIIGALLWFGKLHASSLFDLNQIEDKNDTYSMPNISTMSTFARPIGAPPGSFASYEHHGETASEMPKMKPSSNIIYPPVTTQYPDFPQSSFGTFSSDMISQHTSVPAKTHTPIIPSSSRTPVPHSTNTLSLSNSRIYVGYFTSAVFDQDSPTSENSPSKRFRSDVHVNDWDLEQYILSELRFNGYIKPGKKVALRKVIEFIARNDYIGFIAYEPEFESAFHHKYHLLKRGPSKSDYMMHYIIRFGATQFLNDSAYSRNSSAGSNIAEAFEFLIGTKALDVLLTFIKKGNHLMEDNVMKAISTSVQKRYPNLHFLDYMIFESLYAGIRSYHFDKVLKIYEAKDEERKFQLLTEFLDFSKDRVFSCHFSQLRLLKIPLKYENYFLSLDIELQFYLAKLAVLNGDSEALSVMLELVPNLAVHDSNGNLFLFAVRWDILEIIQFFIEIVPELVSLETSFKFSPLSYTIQYGKIKNLALFEASGVDLTQEIQYQGRTVTPIQLAFELKQPKSFEFILNKIGAENVLQTLLQIYGSRNEIMSHAMRPFASFELVLVLTNRLGFNLKDSYTFEGKTGNFLIFATEVGYRLELLKERLGL